MADRPSAPPDLPFTPVDPAVVRMLRAAGFRIGGGYQTDHQAPGAWPNGTRVRKAGSKPGDINPDGTPGVVEGSVGPFDGRFGYFVRWESMPGAQVFILDTRLTKEA